VIDYSYDEIRKINCTLCTDADEIDKASPVMAYKVKFKSVLVSELINRTALICSIQK
jgi:hypothetical protein